MGVTFDGHDFGDLFSYGDPSISILSARPSTLEVSGRDGSAFVGMAYGMSTVSFAVAAEGGAAARRDAFSTLGAWLDVDGPKQLVLPDTPDRYYLAVPSGALDLQRGLGAEVATVTFELVDPVAYGAVQTATVPSGGSVTFTVGGTAATRPTVTAASAVRNASTSLWGVRLDAGDFLHVRTGSSSARKVLFDCGERTCEVADALAMPTLDSDWLEMAPGQHTVAMDNGTGAATVTWRERWY